MEDGQCCRGVGGGQKHGVIKAAWGHGNAQCWQTLKWIVDLSPWESSESLELMKLSGTIGATWGYGVTWGYGAGWHPSETET